MVYNINNNRYIDESMQACPKKKNTSKGGGEYHHVDSGTEHQPTPCKRSKQVTRQRASQEPPRRPRAKGWRYVTGVTESSISTLYLRLFNSILVVTDDFCL